MPHQPFEILAPAGDEEMLRAAVYSGADCVYLGVQGFNARQGAKNFDAQALASAVAFCHARGCGVYAALNTLVLPGEMERAAEAVRSVAAAGADAVIVQDLGLARLVRTIAPGLALHGSTQMSVHSLAGVQALAKLGFSRVILARELTLEEIAEIAKHSPIELEVFVHGALCVSVSGQCYMSAFLGGRSANRGACAGPCRLPFAAGCGLPPVEKGTPETQRHHLSLKDLSVLDALPALQQAGVVSAKIEGRLRGPEYVAAVVDSARKALRGEPYDKAWLAGVFSRSGFTDGWFTGKGGGEMFGARTEADSALAKAALPKARELYRREMPRVPVRFTLQLGQQGGTLTVTDGAHSLSAPVRGPLEAAQQPMAANLRTALGKTGGTPFYVEEAVVDEGFYLPGAVLSALRRQLLQKLLSLREQPARVETSEAMAIGMIGAPRQRAQRPPEGKPWLRARFSSVAQLPPGAEDFCEELLFPLSQAAEVPQALRGKSRLWLPRILFGKQEERARQQLQAARGMGFKGFEANNVAHLALCEGEALSGGFGLNLANPMSVMVAAANGCDTATLSLELTLPQMREIARQQDAAALDMIAYGHLPLMVTRACPLQNVADCATCPRRGYLTDRKGMHFPVLCEGEVRSILNPIPLWMADRLPELPTAYATLYFTTETADEAGQVLAAFAQGRAAPGEITRGLYYRGAGAKKPL